MKQFKSICILSDDYPSAGRPVYIFVEQLVHAFLDIGVVVYVIAPQSVTRSMIRGVHLLPRRQKYQSPCGCDYWVYRPYSVSFSNGNAFLYRIFDGFNQRALESVLENIRVDVLYGHFWHNAYKLKGFARKNHLPLFVACGEGDDAMERLAASLSTDEKKQLAEAVTGVISVSTENKRRSISLGLAQERNITVLPNAVDITKFHPMERNKGLRQSLGVRDDDFLVLFVGYYIPRKGCHILAEAINKLDDPKIKVMFVGESLKGFMFDPDCRGIVYKGGVPHDELPAFYASADIFVLPTLKEGCSNAIIEALAMAVPVVSSDGPFNDDILNDNNSIRVNPMNVDAIMVAIKKLRQDNQYYQRLKLQMSSAAGHYSISERSQKIVSFINRQMES